MIYFGNLCCVVYLLFGIGILHHVYDSEEEEEDKEIPLYNTDTLHAAIWLCKQKKS